MVKQLIAPPPLFRLQCDLGEGVVWDSKNQRLYFVDINKHRVYTYEPSSNTIGFETYDSPVSYVALRESQPGLVATSKDAVVLLDEDALPFPPTSSTSFRPLSKNEVVSIKPLPKGVARFNDGACDPAGRLTAGTMDEESINPTAKLYLLDSLPESQRVEDLVSRNKATLATLFEGIGCSNGTAWIQEADTKTTSMYYTDSGMGSIYKYDYDITTGRPSNKRVFYQGTTPNNAPDGLCVDTEGGIWTCHWRGGAITRLDTQTGKETHHISFPNCWNITCCVFGGPNLDVLYITTASCNTSGDRPQSEMPESGDLYAIPNLGFRGVERGRYKG